MCINKIIHNALIYDVAYALSLINIPGRKEEERLFRAYSRGIKPLCFKRKNAVIIKSQVSEALVQLQIIEELMAIADLPG